MVQAQTTLCKSCKNMSYDQLIKCLFKQNGYANLRSTLDELLEDAQNSTKE